MSKITINELFEAGAHFGHKTSRWHPKMEPYIHSKRGGSHIINLEMTVEELNKALGFINGVASTGKQVLFVGTALVQPLSARAAALRDSVTVVETPLLPDGPRI